MCMGVFVESCESCVPLRFELLESLALGVIANRSNVVEASQIEFFCSEHGHFGGIVMLDRLDDYRRGGKHAKEYRPASQGIISAI